MGISKVAEAGVGGDGWLLVRYDTPVMVALRATASPYFKFMDFTLDFKCARGSGLKRHRATARSTRVRLSC